MTNARDCIFPTNQGAYCLAALTKREYFAAMALQGLLANTSNSRNPVHASDAANLADALIEALNETKSKKTETL